MYPRTARYRSRNSGSSAINKYNYSDVCDDFTVPDFKKLKDSGVLICNPLTSSKSYFGNWPGKITVNRSIKRLTYPYDTITQNVVTNWTRGKWTPISTHPAWVNTMTAAAEKVMTDNLESVVSQHDIDMAITDISSRIGSGTAQLLVTIAEGKKTLSMLCKAMRFLKRDLVELVQTTRRRYRHLNMQQVIDKAWYEFSGLWLEGRYGWRPLVYDAMAQWDASVQAPFAKQRLTKHKVVGNSEIAVPVKWFDYGNIAPLAGYAQLDMRVQRFVKTGQTADFYAMVDGPARVFGVYDLIGTAWELIPMSWVVDKFINLGKVGQALQASLLVDERVGWVTKVSLASCSNPRSVWTQAGPINGSGWTHTKNYDNLSAQAAYHEGFKKVTRQEILSFTPVIGLEGPLDFAEYIDLATLIKKLSPFRHRR